MPAGQDPLLGNTHSIHAMGRLFFRSLFGPRCLCHATVGGVLVLVLVEEKSTAPQQNFVRSPMPLPNFGDRRWRPGPGLFRGELNGAPAKCFFGPRCLCQIFVTVLGVLVLVFFRGEVNGAPAKVFSVPGASAKFS